MGTLKKVANANYSANAVGKYDFNTNIFRRKIGNTLERNYLSLQQTVVASDAKVSLASDSLRIQLSYFDNNKTQAANLFSVYDYVLRRGFYVAVTVANNIQTINVWMGKETNFSTNTSSAYQDSIVLGNVGVENEHNLDIVIDFNQLKVMSLLYNNAVKTVSRGTNLIATGRFTNGQTRTIAFGVNAGVATDSGLAEGKPSFAQISDINGIFLHYDFLGDNDIEKLTDKARMITLQGQGFITSRPIIL